MSVTAFPNPISKKIVNIKSDYSHITSRLFSSLQKSKQKNPPQKQQILSQTLKLSKEKVSHIADQKYKIAMRHMEKFKKLDEQVKQRKFSQKLDAQCTFKPKILQSKRYKPEARFMNISFTERNLMKSKDTSSKTPMLKDQSFKSIVNHNKDQNGDQRSKKKVLGQKLAERLMNWGKDRDTKIVEKRIQAQLSKSISRNSSVGSHASRKSQKKSTISKERSYRQLYDKKLYITMPLENKESERSPRLSEYTKGYDDRTTPKKPGRINSQLAKSMISLQGVNSIKTAKRKQLLNGLLEEIENDRIQEKDLNYQQDNFMKNRAKFYTEVSSTLNVQIKPITLGEKILMNQTQRGENSFYLRQAKANINKNYEKMTDVLIKNNQYSKKYSSKNANFFSKQADANFSTKYVKAVVLRSKQAKK